MLEIEDSIGRENIDLFEYMAMLGIVENFAGTDWFVYIVNIVDEAVQIAVEIVVNIVSAQIAVMIVNRFDFD